MFCGVGSRAGLDRNGGGILLRDYLCGEAAFGGREYRAIQYFGGVDEAVSTVKKDRRGRCCLW